MGVSESAGINRLETENEEFVWSFSTNLQQEKMPVNIKELLLNTEGCVLQEIDPDRIEAYRLNIPPSAPEDISSLFSDFKRVWIFDDRKKIPANQNSWDLQPGFFTNSPTITAHFGPPLPEDEYMAEYYDKFYLLGNIAADGAHIIGVSFHPASSGMIFDYFVDSFGAPVGMRKIANSFTEWTEKTLAAGPDGMPYWFSSDFIDLGPAVPNDPYYKPIGRVDESLIHPSREGEGK